MSDKKKKTKSEKLYAKSDRLFEKDQGKLKSKATKRQQEGKNMDRIMKRRNRVQEREQKVFIKASEAEKKENGGSMKKFKVHMIYKDCKEVEAKTMREHNKLKKKGYSHKKSKDCKTKKDGSSFNAKLEKEVAEGNIKGNFAKAVMGKK